MTIKIAMNTLTLPCYTHKEFLAPPISGMGGASARVDYIGSDRRLAVTFDL